jgi:hypothetical protein
LANIGTRSPGPGAHSGVGLGLLRFPFSSSEYIEWCQFPRPVTPISDTYRVILGVRLTWNAP